MPLIIVPRYTRADLRANPTWLYAFGDNMLEKGLGGQAKAARGEPNAVGIPTKWSPSLDAEAFFSDKDYPLIQPFILTAFARLWQHLSEGGTVVWPKDGVGSGLAELEARAPRIWTYLEEMSRGLSGDNMPSDLFDADPQCAHHIVGAIGGGIKCTKCAGWFCY